AGTCWLLDTRRGKMIHAFAGSIGLSGSYRLRFSPDGQRLAMESWTDNQDQASIWLGDVATGKRVPRSPRNELGGDHFAFSPSGSLFATWHHPVIASPPWSNLPPEEPLSPEVQRIKVWELATGTLVTAVPDPGCATSCVCLSGKGSLLAAGRPDG